MKNLGGRYLIARAGGDSGVGTRQGSIHWGLASGMTPTVITSGVHWTPTLGTPGTPIDSQVYITDQSPITPGSFMTGPGLDPSHHTAIWLSRWDVRTYVIVVPMGSGRRRAINRAIIEPDCRDSWRYCGLSHVVLPCLIHHSLRCPCNANS